MKWKHTLRSPKRDVERKQLFEERVEEIVDEGVFIKRHNAFITKEKRISWCL